MPASMMSAETGGSTKVAGSSIEMVAIGPMPGSTPISVPSSTPMKQYQMLLRVSATPNPRIRLFRSSMRFSLAPAEADARLQRLDVGAQRDRQLQSHHEDQGAKDSQADPEDDARFRPKSLGIADPGDDHQQQSGDQHADRLEDHAEKHHGSEH